MSPVTVVWSMIAGACVTLALVYVPMRWQKREDWASLAFSLAAVCTALAALCELSMLGAQTPAEYVTALKLAHVAVALLLIALAAFTYLYLGTGRLWLAIAGIVLRLLALPSNFVPGQALNYREVTALKSASLLGEPVAVALGVPNLWMSLAQLGVLLLVVFVVDATVTARRRGAGNLAVGVGAGIAFFMLAGVVQGILVHWGYVKSPTTFSLFSLGIVGAMGYAMSRDLANARQLVLDLSEREQEAALTADAANVGIWTRDIARNTMWANDKWRELFGFASGEPLELERVLKRIHPDDRGLAFENGLISAPLHHDQYHSEYRLTLPDGRTRWISHQGRVEFDARRRPLRTRGVSIDITARKQAEQEMSRLRQDIAHVGRVSVMGQLASALAHEINQPLGAILRNAEAAALFMQDPSPDLHEISAIVEDIRKDDQRASAVIDRMRSLLRRQEVQMAPLEVGQVLGDVTALLRPDATARHVKVELDIPPDVPQVLGDRVQLQQVLLNLILNGMDALEGRGGDNRRVRVSARGGAGQEVEISVSDSGRGIADGDFERIFEPFFSTKPKGIGMGLSISRGIVEAHRGRLWAENGSGGGATFRFTLPIAH